MVLLDSTHAFSLLVFVLVILSQDEVVAAKTSFTRKISLFYNPGCNITECNSTMTNSTVNLIYTRAQGTNDSLHYILSTVGPSSPTILLLRSEDNDAMLQINWTQFLFSNLKNVAGSIKLVSENDGSELMANIENVIILDKVLEYNDSIDDAAYNASMQFTPIMLTDMIWDVNITNAMQAMLKGRSSKYPDSLSANSTVSINFSPFNSDGQSDILPSLPHNANSSEWEINLDSLISRGNGSRFGIGMVVLSSKTNVTKSKIKTIDDEYSPSIFTTEKLEWSHKMTKKTETFSQWRAVSYTTTEHERKYATDVKTGSLQNVDKSSPEYIKSITSNRLLQAYFNSSRLAELEVQSVDVNFGEPEDGFYKATNYLSWTLTVGFSSPPVDVFSTLVICILFAGVGCPLLVIIAGGIYFLYLKVKRRNRFSFKDHLVTNYDYQPIS